MDRVGLARRIIDFGLTQADLDLGADIGLAGAEQDALLQAAPGPARLQAARPGSGSCSRRVWHPGRR